MQKEVELTVVWPVEGVGGRALDLIQDNRIHSITGWAKFTDGIRLILGLPFVESCRRDPKNKKLYHVRFKRLPTKEQVISMMATIDAAQRNVSWYKGCVMHSSVESRLKEIDLFASIDKMISEGKLTYREAWERFRGA